MYKVLEECLGFAPSYYQLKSGLELGRDLGAIWNKEVEKKGGVRVTQKNVGPILRSSNLRGGTTCGVGLEIIVCILNKFDFTCFLGYLSINTNS